MAKPDIHPSVIGKYIKFSKCHRFFKLAFDGEEEKNARQWGAAFESISPLLSIIGVRFEEECWEQLKQRACYAKNLKESMEKVTDWKQATQETETYLKHAIQTVKNTSSESAYAVLYNPPLYGELGSWMVKGRPDLVTVWQDEDDKIKMKLFEIKASWEERTYHRIQVAMYVFLLEQLLESVEISVEPLEAGVLTRETVINGKLPKELPSFDLEPMRWDVLALLREGGELEQLHQKDLAKINYQLNETCEACQYSICCFTRAIESEDISLLNITRGEQEVLYSHDIHTLQDLAALKKPPNEQRPYNFQSPATRHPDKIQQLEENSLIASKLDPLIQRAQVMLGKLRPNYEYATDPYEDIPWTTGTGYGHLPEDDPPSQVSIEPEVERGSLIRIYLHVQWDYILERIAMISGVVDATKYKGEPIELSSIIEEIPETQEESLEVERTLLETFFQKLFNAIKQVASQTDNPERAPIHLYFYTKHERDRLMEAIRRHSSLSRAEAVRDLLGLREAIDQPMTAIIKKDLTERKSLKYPNRGLLPVLSHLNFHDVDWKVQRSDGTTLQLYNVFRHNFFDYNVPYYYDEDGSIHLILDKDTEKGEDGWYPTKARFFDQIPLEYFWAAKDKLTPDLTENYTEKQNIEKYRWHNPWKKKYRVTEEDLKLLGKTLCHAIKYIERNINYKNVRLGKQPIDVPTIDKFTLGEPSLAEACEEYLDLEYFSQRQELYQYYGLMPEQRVKTGKSVIFRCKNIEKDEDSPSIKVEGKLLYDELQLVNPDQVANACRLKGGRAFSSGDWMVLTPLTKNDDGRFREYGKRKPYQIEKSPRAIIEDIDPKKRTITLEILNYYRKGKEYSVTHNNVTTNPRKAQKKHYTTLLEEGNKYILDKYADDIIAEKTHEALSHAAQNSLYTLFHQSLTGKPQLPKIKHSISQNDTKPFIKWLNTEYENPPNSKQQAFISQLSNKHPISLLQGPPGTGKTATVSWTTLTHLLAHHNKLQGTNKRCRALMVAPTHKAVHEFVEKFYNVWQSYQATNENSLGHLNCVRVLSSESRFSEKKDEIKYLNYHEDKELLQTVKQNLYPSQSKLGESLEGSCPPILLAATPGTIHGLMTNVWENKAWEKAIFDLLVVDEASMMQLPDLLLSSSFLSNNAKILVAGDHRQLPPVQKHNWQDEDRRTIEELAPYLSAQNFLRVLRGENLGIEHIKTPKRIDIPVTKLEISYRCHPTITNFLKRWVYQKDNIDFQAAQTRTIPQVTCNNSAVNQVLKPKNALTLILHNNKTHFQANPIEATIIQTIVKNLKNQDIGIVTPHNAQRGLLTTTIGQHTNRIDTVERFQGGQNDVIILSATVSDPSYIQQESDFLLNLNRLNVAMSRMRKKLIVIASTSIFNYMPKEANTYDQGKIWRGLLTKLATNTQLKPDWKGFLSGLTGSNHNKNVKVNIYTT